MRNLKNFLKAILAGICIGLGGTIYLISMSKGQPLLGAFLFSIGLLLILIFNLNLYTGKIDSVFENKPIFLLDLLIIFIGNWVGSLLYGYGLKLTRLDGTLSEVIKGICETKLSDNGFSILILSILCGFLVYTAVASWKNEKLPGIARFMMVVLCIGTFVACGFEHVVANMFYFSFGNAWSWHAVLYILLMGLGNSLGAFFIPLLNMLKEKN